MAQPLSVIYQRAKIRQPALIREDVQRARSLLTQTHDVGRLYGTSGGALVALAHALTLSAGRGGFTQAAARALDDLDALLSSDTRLMRINWQALPYGLKNLDPLRRWLMGRLAAYHPQGAALRLSGLAVPTYLVAADKDGFPVFFGLPDESIHHAYHNFTARTEDAPIVEACIAALSTIVQFDAVSVNGDYYTDIRPQIADLRATVLDMEASEPRPISASEPHIPSLDHVPDNALVQGFKMHRWYARNQARLTAHYTDLWHRTRDLEATLTALLHAAGQPDLCYESLAEAPQVGHARVQYLTSTQMIEDTRISIEEREHFIGLAQEVAAPQLARFDFTRPYNIYYGAGGLSSVLIQLGIARIIDGWGGTAPIGRIYGCSAGLLIGLYHAAKLGAMRTPHLYTAEAHNALTHMEELFTGLHVRDVFRLNIDRPARFVKGFTRPGSLLERIVEDVARWAGVDDGRAVTFEDLQLPLVVAATRGSDGSPVFYGVPGELGMTFGGKRLDVQNAPIIDALEGGIALPLYVAPMSINGDTALDGGAGMFDLEFFTAAMEPNPPSLLCIHTGEPVGYTYGYPARPNLLRATYDTHSYMIPEMRRRSVEIVNLFYRYLGVRHRARRVREALRAQPELLAAHPLPDVDSAWWVQPQSWKV